MTTLPIESPMLPSAWTMPALACDWLTTKYEATERLSVITVVSVVMASLRRMRLNREAMTIESVPAYETGIKGVKMTANTYTTQ